MKRLLILFSFLALSACAKTEPGRWSVEKANQWAADKGWVVGCNYIAATAINQIEMWQESTRLGAS